MRVRRIVWGLAALLLAGGLLIANPFAGPGALSWDSGPMQSATLRAGGVTMTIRVPRDAYFLGELLPVTISLANRSHRILTLGGRSLPNPCGDALGVLATGGTAPRYVLPVSMSIPCPSNGTTTLASGQSLTMRQLLALPASGRVTLAAQAQFLAATTMSGVPGMSGAPGPFGGRWPSLTIAVSPRVPAHRTLSLSDIGPLVIVGAPWQVRPHLLYLYGVNCTGTGSGNAIWQPIPSGVVYDPGCPGPNEQWSVTVSAPGYAVTSAIYAGRGEGKI